MEFNRTKFWGASFASFLWMVSPLAGQTIEAKITFHTDKLSLEEREFISELPGKLKRAIETHRWEGAKRPHTLPISYDVFWDKASRSGTIHHYTAGMLISLENGLALRDRRVEFRFATDDWIHLGEPFEPLTGILEFYTWICLGFDADRISPLGGNLFYQQALSTGERARSEPQFSLGWDDRREMAIEITDSLYSPLRRARFHAAAGLYYTGAGNSPQAQAQIARATALLTRSSLKHSSLEIEDHIFRYVDVDQLLKIANDLGMTEEAATLEEWRRNELSEENR